MEDKIVQVSYVDFETGKSFITVPKSYRSNFNKLTLIHDEFEIYCEPIDILCYQGFEDDLVDCDLYLATEWLKQEMNKFFINEIYNCINVPHYYEEVLNGLTKNKLTQIGLDSLNAYVKTSPEEHLGKFLDL